MDLMKTGRFIAERRKWKKLTQFQLAQLISVSEKTISKWECGKGFPDTSLILPLCEALEISANELLEGRLLPEKEYQSCAEKNLVLLKSQQEQASKHLLLLEVFLGCLSTILLLGCTFVAGFFLESLIWKILLIVFGMLIFVVCIVFALLIEKEVGFYECGKCHHKYIPTFKAVFFSMHIGRTRFLKCPKCQKKSWSKKRISK